MDHLDGTYLIGTDDESDDNSYVAQNQARGQVAVNLGHSRITVTSRRLANLHRFRQELLPPQPLATTSAFASTASAPAGQPDSGSATADLSQTLTRLVNAAWDGHRQAHPTITAAGQDVRQISPEERAQANDLWHSISVQPTSWIWPAPADDGGFVPAGVWTPQLPAGQSGSGIVHGEPLTGWEPNVVCTRQHAAPHMTLQQCITDPEKLFNGDARLNRKIDGPLPISSFERLFFALWASRYHSLPKRNPNNHFEARRPNEKTADFLADILTRTNHSLPQLVNVSFDSVVAGTPAPHFNVGDLRIAVLRWYESCPASRKFLDEHISGPAEMEFEYLHSFRADIRRQLEELLRDHFADALDTLRLRLYYVRVLGKPKWRNPRDQRPLPSTEEDPLTWRIKPRRILDHENVIFADSWGVHLAPQGNATTVVLSEPADHALQSAKKFFLSHQVKNVYWFWGRDGLSDSQHDITPDWYSSLSEHFVCWFPHTRLFIMMPPYTRANDYYWSRIIKRVLENLQDHCLNATVITDPLDLKLHDYHEQWTNRDGGWQFGYPPWPTEEQDTEGTPSVDSLRRRKTFMKEKFGITLWDHEANDSMDNDLLATGQRNVSSGPSGSGTVPSASPPVRHSHTPLPAPEDDPETALITRLREMFPNPSALHTQMRDVGRFLNVLHQLEYPVYTPTWLAVYPALSSVEAVNMWGAYKHLAYSAFLREPYNDGETDAPLNSDPGHLPVATAAGSRSSSGQSFVTAYVPHNPSTGHPSVATAAGGRSPPGSTNRTSNTSRNPGSGHPSVATAAGGRSPPVSSDTIRNRTSSSTEQRRGTPRASSRGQAAPRAQHLPWPGQQHDW